MFIDKQVYIGNKQNQCCFNVGMKLFRCDCDKKQYKVTIGSLKTIIAHIKQCRLCIVNVDFNEFIFKRTGKSEIEIMTRKMNQENERINDERIEIVPSERTLRSHLH